MRYQYKGSELEIFKYAQNWKKYWFGNLKQFIETKNELSILEIGSGIGSNSQLFKLIDNYLYTGIEPDKNLYEASKIYTSKKINFLNKSLEEFSSDKKFDLILVIDVLEHIDNEMDFLNKIKKIIEKNGVVFLILPAHQFLFSKFDVNVGHFRRYSKKSFIKLVQKTDLQIISIKYLDSIGILPSLIAKIFALQPSQKSVLKWDKFIVPISVIIDKKIKFRLGKSIAVVLGNIE